LSGTASPADPPIWNEVKYGRDSISEIFQRDEKRIADLKRAIAKSVQET
jgi:hypothetical protein